MTTTPPTDLHARLALAREPFAGSRKVHLEGPLTGVRVPMREIALSNGERVIVHDTSGPCTDPSIPFDVRQGLPALRTAWIESRGKLFLDERGQPERMVGICADVTQRKQSEVDLRVSEQFNRTLIDSSRDCFKTLALDGTIQWISETGKDALCISDLSAVIGKSWIDFWQGEERVSAREAVQAAARGGTGNLVGRMTIDGRTRWWDVVVTPILDANGQPEKLLAVSRDITERKQDEQTTRFLADTNAALAELTDYQSTLHKVANLAVPFFADWCAVDMLEPDGSVKRLAITHTDPIKAQLAFELDRRYPARTSDPHGAMHVLQTRKPELVTEIPRGLLESLAQNDEHLQFALTLGFKSYICVPLMSRTRILGAMTFVTAESGRIYDDDDLRTAEDLAHRAAIAIENASLLAALRGRIPGHVGARVAQSLGPDS